MKQLKWCQQVEQPIIKVPLLFTFHPVQALMKELTRLNSTQPFRISYLGPRWADSVTFHKKYSSGGHFPFDQRRVAKNNSFLSESMTNNQFYKNQIFYRAFEGMNPTLNLEQEMVFESRFEGGNLDCVVKVNDHEYDLFLRIDSNTRGHLNWFYFMVKNGHPGKKIRLNICNLTKADTHYSKGLTPFTFSSIDQQWTQERITNVSFKQKKIRYAFLYQKMTIRNFYTLSFDIQFTGSQEIKIAYCVPYTYSDLMVDLKEISSVAEIGTLGQTLTGINIPMVMIGKHEEECQKQVLMITGRIHPGESNSSHVVSKLMKFLCFSPQARFLRQKIIIIIIPMVNPDGVILGNSRCGASGKDLNRQFKTKSRVMFPQVVLLKGLVEKILETHDLQMYLDFHGHSRKKNVFMFGPDYNITQPDYYKCRVFPKLLSNVTNIFRYYSCSFDISNDKKTTARAVMLNDLLVPIFFTVESSLGYYHDYNLKKNVPFSKKKWEEIGQSIGAALKEYYEGIVQYESFIQAKRKYKKQIAQQIKQVNQPSQGATSPKKNTNRELSPLKKQQKDTKDIKLFKIYQEIKELEQKRIKQDKKDKATSDNESDSHDQNESFEKEKMMQFSGMLIDFVEQEAQKKNNSNYQESKGRQSPQKTENLARKNRFELKRKRQQKMKEEQLIFAENFQIQDKSKLKRNEIKTQHRPRNIKKEESPDLKSDRIASKPASIVKVTAVFKDQEVAKQEKERQLSHQFLQEDVDFFSLEKRANRMNVRMFNFSKMVQNSTSGKYHDLKHKQIRILKPKTPESFEYTKSVQIQYPVTKKHRANLSQIRQEQGSSLRAQKEEVSISKTTNEDNRAPKSKLGFPSSFYRIKYHNSLRKKQQHKKQRYSDHTQSLQRKPRGSSLQQNTSPQISSTRKVEGNQILFDEEQRKVRLYAQLRRLRKN